MRTIAKDKCYKFSEYGCTMKIVLKEVKIKVNSDFLTFNIDREIFITRRKII